MEIDAHCSASSMSKPDSFRDILSLHILGTDLPRIHLIDNFSYVVFVGNSGNQPYTTSGLAITRTLFTFCILLLRALSVRPCGLFQQLELLKTMDSQPYP